MLEVDVGIFVEHFESYKNGLCKNPTIYLGMHYTPVMK